MTKKLTIESMKKTMQKAYLNGELISQNRDKYPYYFYRKPGLSVGCAVGVCLTDEQADKLDQGMSLSYDKNYPITRDFFVNDVAFSWAETAQWLHDQWGNYEHDFKVHIGLI